ncbi:MAG TPA: hypothetical protein VMT47_07810, partial [Polyangia bacterium]|nr:hypothetical protein [Polyangia bacterium]
MRGSTMRHGWLLRAAVPLALLVFVAGLALGPMAESDLFFRVEAGRQILARHGLPGHNLYSFTYPDHPDVDTAWLFEVGAAALYERGGFPALVLAKTAVLVATFAGAFALARRRGAGPASSALALAAAAFAGRERFVERPHIFTLAGVVLILAVADALASDDAEASPATPGVAKPGRVIAAALGCIVFWANLHAGVFLAPALLALAAFGARLDRSRGARRLAWLASGAALAALATPVGWGLVTYLRLHTILPALHPVDEFRAASWISDAPLLSYGAAVAVAAVAMRPRRWRVLLPAAALGLLALRSIRFGADFALLAASLLAVALTRLARRARLSHGFAASAAVTGLLLALALGPRVAAARAGRPALALGLDERALPLDALRFVDANGLRERMYNDFELGSYLLFEGYPRYRVFVDPRLPAYPPELHALLGRADLSRGAWDEAMRRYGVDSALLADAGLNRRVAWWDPATWALVYRAHDARVFVRRLPRFAALIAAREIPATFSFTLEAGTLTLPLEPRPTTSPVADCEWQRRLGDLLFELDGEASTRARAAYAGALAAPTGCLAAADERRLASWLGAFELGAGRAGTAVALLDRALALGDLDVTTRINRALALEREARLGAAAATWDEVAARAADPTLADKARALAA